MQESLFVEKVNEKKLLVKVTLEEEGTPLIFPEELVFVLWGRLDLLGICIQLYLLTRIVSDTFITQPNLAKVLGIDYGIFLKKRKELEELRLIRVDIQNHNLTRISLTFGKLWGLRKNLRPSKEKPKTPQGLKSVGEIRDYLVNTSNSLKEVFIDVSLNPEKLSFFNNIYIHNNNIINNNINNNNISNNDINTIANIDNKKTFAKEDYNLVLEAFKKYKGVDLKGPEISYHLRAIKMMFQAGRTPKEISNFMKWLYDNRNNEQTRWVTSWTIWTVQKKIPEFIAGKLNTNQSFDEEYPDL